MIENSHGVRARCLADHRESCVLVDMMKTHRERAVRNQELGLDGLAKLDREIADECEMQYRRVRRAELG